MTTTLAHAPIDPLHAAAGGRYDDGRVVVRRIRGLRGIRADLTAGPLVVRHGLSVVDDDLAEDLAHVLAPHTGDADVFARAFTGVVLTSSDDPLTAWERFYRASLARTRADDRPGYAEIYRHATTLLPRTSVLDLGAGFGFLALHLAGLGAEVLAADIDAGAQSLLGTMSARLGLPVRIVGAVADLPDASVDAVALLHVLEHLDDATGAELVRHAVRVARHRVVVAVPYEQTATALYGHVRTIDAADLTRLGGLTGWTARRHEHHGGWLVLDRPEPSPRPIPLRRPAPPDPRTSIAGARRRAALH